MFDTSLDAPRWYAAQVTCGLEATTAYHLNREVIENFSACLADRRRSLYPGYTFVKLRDPELECCIVNRTRGVIKMLPVHARMPMPLPVGFVEDLRDCATSGKLTEEWEAQRLNRFLPQELVIPLSGVYRDQLGRFLRYHKGSGVILGSLLGKEFEFKVPLHQLAKVAE